MPRWTTLGWEALVALGVALVLVLLWGLVRLRRKLRRGKIGRPLTTRNPVVFVHGLFGFDEVGRGPWRQSYFRRVPAHLGALGLEVVELRLPAAASIAQRAAALVEQVRALDAPQVNIIAHSMGGLDARYAIAVLGLAPRVASLVTVGTPHRGTPIADAATGLVGERPLVTRALGALGLDVAALSDLTTTHMQTFNREVRDRWGIWYASVVSAVGPGDRVHPLLRPTKRYLDERVGPNDGLVPLASQRWGAVWRTLSVDHWAEIGWSRRFDAVILFEELVRELRGRGL